MAHDNKDAIEIDRGAAGRDLASRASAGAAGSPMTDDGRRESGPGYRGTGRSAGDQGSTAAPDPTTAGVYPGK